MGRCVSHPRRTARLLSESEIGQGGLGRACSEEEEGVKGKKEEESAKCVYDTESGNRMASEIGKDLEKLSTGRTGYPADLNVYPFKSCRTGRVVLRGREKEREGGEWYHADSVGIEKTYCRTAFFQVVFLLRLFGRIDRWAPLTARRSGLSATPPRRLRLSSSGPRFAPGPYAGIPSPPESARINGRPRPRTTPTRMTVPGTASTTAAVCTAIRPPKRTGPEHMRAGDWWGWVGGPRENANGNEEGGKRRRGERGVSHSSALFSSSPLGLAVLLSILSATMAGACLCTWRWRIGLGPLLSFYWLLHFALDSASPWMAMGIVALAVDPHERVQGSVVSTTTRHLLSACYNPSIALSAPASSFVLFTLLHREHLLLILTRFSVVRWTRRSTGHTVVVPWPYSPSLSRARISQPAPGGTGMLSYTYALCSEGGMVHIYPSIPFLECSLQFRPGDADMLGIWDVRCVDGCRMGRRRGCRSPARTVLNSFGRDASRSQFKKTRIDPAKNLKRTYLSCLMTSIAVRGSNIFYQQWASNGRIVSRWRPSISRNWVLQCLIAATFLDDKKLFLNKPVKIRRGGG
ncbi:hypothetical protein B0H13DRAFT_1918015 [Mycena leptocephala]|nr:hypothetical protein B0H13DRAFT_1918015 [Mycena leptocephala]